MYTSETATKYVVTELESTGAARREDFDVSAIVATLHRIADSWDFDFLDRRVFWGVAASRLRF
ncbi:hypothetical protein NONO_c67260 [Nocardia nova SH22a]|uniref:Uncharacterized protein n=1 Tax=Nocardia nova SH22a TaxID=1415166 RepID=W5TRE1_9NOCA|nr:hypothetical protein NONO_c67260 [Nocardia nova SH22a]